MQFKVWVQEDEYGGNTMYLCIKVEKWRLVETSQRIGDKRE
jgi:hypothetical protein